MFRFFMLALFSLLMVTDASAAANFAEALPTSLIPDSFWDVVVLIFALVIAIAGVGLVIRLIKKSM